MNIESKILARFDFLLNNESTLTEWAVSKLEQDLNSSNINELSWGNSETSSRELFLNSVNDLNITIAPEKERNSFLLKDIAEKIINKEIDINLGCSVLSEISQKSGSPQNLAVFELLAHEQSNHENIGITNNNIQPSIIKEARILINS